jgi:hypothetical protein
VEDQKAGVDSVTVGVAVGGFGAARDDTDKAVTMLAHVDDTLGVDDVLGEILKK